MKHAPVQAGCFTTNEEVRVEVIAAFAQLIKPGDDTAELIDELIKFTKEDWSRTAAVRALSKIGPSADRAVPVLLKLQDVEPASGESFEIARAISRLRPTGSIALLGVRRVLKAVGEDESYSSFGCFGFADCSDLIVELGDRARPLIPELAFLVEEHELLHREHRIHAAYALANLEPTNPKWRERLERWAAMDSIIMNPSTGRLEQLLRRDRMPDEAAR